MSQARTEAVHGHLAAMLAADKELYERVMDTPGFAFHMNQILLLAEADGFKVVVEDDLESKAPDARAVHYPNGLDAPQPYVEPAVMDVADALRESKPVAAELNTGTLGSGLLFVAGDSVCTGNTSARPLTWADVDLLRGTNVASEMTGDRDPINEELAELADRIAERLPPREMA